MRDTESRRPRNRLGLALLCLVLTICPSLHSQAADQSAWKQYERLEEAGWSASLLEEARLYSESIRSAAVMIVYRGYVVAAWGDIERRYKCHSVRKSLLSLLYGVHVGEGTIDLNKTIEDLGIDDLQPLSPAEKQARISDLLKARSGIYHPAAKETSDMMKNRPPRGSHKPGTFFCYNNWDFNVAGVIFEQETGTRIFEEFKKRIADPTGMQDFRLKDTYYQYERRKTRHPAYSFRMSARDLARVGLLMLKRGWWNGTRLVPEAWVQDSTTAFSLNEQGIGYGYMWWVYPRGGLGQDSRYKLLNTYDKFAASGTGGQWILVVPKAEIVIVHRGDTDNNRRVSGRDIWWLAEKIFAARTSNASPTPLLKAVAPIPYKWVAPALLEREEIALDPQVLDSYTGEYAVAQGPSLSLERIGNVLAADFGPLGEVDFFAESESRFFARAENILLEFIKNEQGRVTGVKLSYRGRVYVAVKVR